ncbi:MAG: hypothetical protein V3V31_00095 [Methylococcales bacterium]
MKKILILITMLLFSSLATAQWCTGAPDQNISVARANFKAKCGETWNDQKHVCDHKPDGFHCNGNISASGSTPTQTPNPATSNTGGGDNTSSTQSQSLAAPINLGVTYDTNLARLAWVPVTGAAGYNVYRNEKYLDTVITNVGYIDNKPVGGENEYYVIAFDASKKVFSPKSNKVVFVNILSGGVVDNGNVAPIDKPTGLAGRAFGDSVSLTWNAVNGAVEYEIFLGLRSVARTRDNSVILTGFDPGEYSFSVRAHATWGAWSNFSDSISIVVTTQQVDLATVGNVVSGSDNNGDESNMNIQSIDSSDPDGIDYSESETPAGEPTFTVVDQSTGQTTTIYFDFDDPTQATMVVNMDPDSGQGEVFDGNGNFVTGLDVTESGGVVTGETMTDLGPLHFDTDLTTLEQTFQDAYGNPQSPGYLFSAQVSGPNTIPVIDNNNPDPGSDDQGPNPGGPTVDDCYGGCVDSPMDPPPGGPTDDDCYGGCVDTPMTDDDDDEDDNDGLITDGSRAQKSHCVGPVINEQQPVEAKVAFGSACNTTYNDQLGHQCEWVANPQGWRCFK